jgi:hypothetical protein
MRPREDPTRETEDKQINKKNTRIEEKVLRGVKSE